MVAQERANSCCNLTVRPVRLPESRVLATSRSRPAAAWRRVGRHDEKCTQGRLRRRAVSGKCCDHWREDRGRLSPPRAGTHLEPASHVGACSCALAHVAARGFGGRLARGVWPVVANCRGIGVFAHLGTSREYGPRQCQRPATHASSRRPAPGIGEWRSLSARPNGGMGNQSTLQ